jgi:hypothetical protein
MSGKPGRSGKARTPEDRRAKREFARMGGHAKAGRTMHADPPDDADRPEGSVEHSPALLAAVPDAADYPFPVLDGLAAKDLMEFLLKRKKVEQAEVELDEARIKRDLSRGALKTKTEYREAITAIVEEIVSRLSILTDAAVELHPPEQQPRVRHLMDTAVRQLREEVRAKLKEQTK